MDGFGGKSIVYGVKRSIKMYSTPVGQESGKRYKLRAHAKRKREKQ